MKYRIFAAAFMLLCVIPSLGMLVQPETQPTANERLAAKPSFTTAAGGLNENVLTELTNYVADHFAFRQQMVTANAALQTTLLATSPASDVIYGADGWLYYEKTLNDYQNTPTLTDEQARQVAQTIADMQAYCEARGAAFLFTIAPNKSSVYPGNMPKRYLKNDADNNYSLVTKYFEELGIHYADLMTFFKSQSETFYLKTDSHWSNRGAALAHDFLMEQLGRPYSPFGTRGYTTENTHRGDLYAMLYPAGTALEAQQKYEFTLTYDTPPRNEEDILMKTTSETGTGRLLLCRDSFGNALHPFLAEDFATATITRAMPYPLAEVQAGDTVIIEIVERNLPNLLKYPPALDGTIE